MGSFKINHTTAQRNSRNNRSQSLRLERNSIKSQQHKSVKMLTSRVRNKTKQKRWRWRRGAEGRESWLDRRTNTSTHAQHTDSLTVQRGVYSFFSALCFPQSPAKIMCIRTVFARFLRFLRQKTARTKVATLNLHIFSHTSMHNFRAPVCVPCHVDYLVVFHFFFCILAQSHKQSTRYHASYA